MDQGFHFTFVQHMHTLYKNTFFDRLLCFDVRKISLHDHDESYGSCPSNDIMKNSLMDVIKERNVVLSVVDRVLQKCHDVMFLFCVGCHHTCTWYSYFSFFSSIPNCFTWYVIYRWTENHRRAPTCRPIEFARQISNCCKSKAATGSHNTPVVT